ncbi:MAG TPA: molecular chaperone, partial [Hyphomicrobiaceae bacterium]|nr:molecular chaperone [Hyphomicrobiaceae bacterium]
MRQIDFAPLYRSTVGFDRLFDMLEGVSGIDAGPTAYPPYNIERLGDNEYRITMAVAGFSEDEL